MSFIYSKALELKDVLTVSLASVAVIVGLLQYYFTSRREFLRPIRESQLNLYLEACSAAGKLATLPDNSEEWQKARLDFLRLFYGPMAVVENYSHKPDKQNPQITVERAMIAFKKCLDRSESGGTKELRALSLALAHTCRVSLGKSWGFKAAQLEGAYQKLITTLEST